MDIKILLVEDNKSLAKLLAKKMEAALDAEVDVAYSFAEAKLFIAKNPDYFISLLDLNLPDAPDGEVVDYVLSKNILSIVLTGNIDEKTKSTFMDKPIVDYVYKGNMDDVNYVFTMIKRLYNNRKYKVMIVDDSIPVRNMAKNILQSQQFQVFAAAHGEEALKYFEDHPDIKLVITDYHMPIIDGLELVLDLRKRYTKNELSIIALTSFDEDSTAAKFLKYGANDFISKPFGKEEMICRINNSIEAIENIETIADLANHDFMTGAYNRRFFFNEMPKYIQETKENEETYALAMVDIDNFKSINDTYGHDIGDKVIIELVKTLKDDSKGSDYITRFGGEEFCVVLKDLSKEESIEWFVKMRAKIASKVYNMKKDDITFSISIGLTFSSDKSLDEIIEEADSALYYAKRNGRNRVEIFEEV